MNQSIAKIILSALFVIAISVSAFSAPIPVDLDLINPQPSGSDKTISFLSDSCQSVAYWEAIAFVLQSPYPGSDYDYFNMRFSSDRREKIDKVRFYFLESYSTNISGSGIDVVIWSSDTLTGLPAAELHRINVLASELIYYPAAFELDLSAYDYEVSGDFHVGYTTVNGVIDTFAVTASNTNPKLRSSFYTAGAWKSLTDEWGYDYDLAIEVDMCEAVGDTVYVPTDYPDIQTAVNNVKTGDVIILEDGTHTGTSNRDVQITNKSVTIQSQNGAGATIIDIGGTESEFHQAFRFTSPYPSNASSHIKGITFKNGYHYYGGAIQSESSMDIQDCVFLNNIGTNGAGALELAGYGLNISRCDFIGNGLDTGKTYGGGIFFSNMGYNNGNVDHCRFIGNRASYGAAMYFVSHAKSEKSNINQFELSSNFTAGVVFANNTFYDNLPNVNYYINDQTVEFLNCNFIYNGPYDLTGDFDVTYFNCNSYSGTEAIPPDVNGNMYFDPLICDTTVFTLEISDMSVCAPGHVYNYSSTYIGADSVGCTDGCVDGDLDNVCDIYDNCEAIANSSQADADSDLIGDDCDICPDDPLNDADGDDVCDGTDNCLGLSNPGQDDADQDLIGDDCDICPDDPLNDPDGDDVCEGIDNCPGLYNPNQTDDNQNNIGDACEGCCVGYRGNIDGDINDIIDIDDIVYFVEYAFGFPSGPEPPCMDEVDIDDSGLIDIDDVVKLVDFAFGFPSGPPPVDCP